MSLRNTAQKTSKRHLKDISSIIYFIKHFVSLFRDERCTFIIWKKSKRLVVERNKPNKRFNLHSKPVISPSLSFFKFFPMREHTFMTSTQVRPRNL